MELNGHLDRPVSIECSVRGLLIDIINASLLRTCPKDGPVLSQTDLFLLHPKLELHPILTHSLKSFHLVFDLVEGNLTNESQHLTKPAFTLL